MLNDSVSYHKSVNSQITYCFHAEQWRSVKGGSGSKTKYKDTLSSVLQIQP